MTVFIFLSSYTWSYEKIRLSMVLVITGQLACSYDEEFRRLYARSIVPTLLSTSGQELKDNVGLLSSTQLPLHQIHMRSRGMPGMRSAQDDRLNNISMLTRGVSMQERLNQSHYPDIGNLVRGQSYGGELQRLNSMSRLRMGTKDFGLPERTGSNMALSNNLQQHRHRLLYGADQNLIPFSSETSLNKWKIDTYLNDSNTPLDAPSDVMSPLTSPYSSLMGLNEHQSQLIQSRSRDVKSRLEEIRQNRLSLQELTHLKQSQESLRSMYPTMERPKLMPSLRGQGIRQSMAELEPYIQHSCSLEPANHKDSEPKMDVPLTDGHRSASHYDIKTVLDQKTVPAHNWHEPLSRTTSATELDMKLSEASLKHSQLPRAMESLIEIPEEKEGSNSRVNAVNSVESNIPPESQHQDVRNESEGSVSYRSGSAAQREGNKSTSNETETDSLIVNTPAGSQHVADSNGQTEKQQEEQMLQRKNSLRLKVYSLLMSDEKKASKKEEKSLQRKASLRSQNPSGSNQLLRADNSWTPSAAEQTPKKGQSPMISRVQNSVSAPSETEKHKSPFSFNRLSPQRSSKKKTNPAEEQDQASRSTASDEAPAVRREKVYSRFEYFLSTDNIPMDKSTRTASMQPSDKDRSSYLNRNDSGYSMYQTQSSSDNKLGRFMQRVGNLIGKNK